MLGSHEYSDVLAPKWRKLPAQILHESNVDAYLVQRLTIGRDRTVRFITAIETNQCPQTSDKCIYYRTALTLS